VWATDSTRFPPGWIRAVKEAIAAARSQVRKS
jgi:hypothetical protein